MREGVVELGNPKAMGTAPGPTRAVFAGFTGDYEASEIGLRRIAGRRWDQ